MKRYANCALAFGGNVSAYTRELEYFNMKWTEEDYDSWTFFSSLQGMKLPSNIKFSPSIYFVMMCNNLPKKLIHTESSLDFRREFPDMKVFGFTSFPVISSHAMNNSRVRFPYRSSCAHYNSVILCVLRFRQKGLQ